jgi:hypothetical protein
LEDENVLVMNLTSDLDILLCMAGEEANSQREQQEAAIDTFSFISTSVGTGVKNFFLGVKFSGNLNFRGRCGDIGKYAGRPIQPHGVKVKFSADQHGV